MDTEINLVSFKILQGYFGEIRKSRILCIYFWLRRAAYWIISVPSARGILLEGQQDFFFKSEIHKTKGIEEKLEATKFWIPEIKWMRATGLAYPTELTAKTAVRKAKTKLYLCHRTSKRFRTWKHLGFLETGVKGIDWQSSWDSQILISKSKARWLLTFTTEGNKCLSSKKGKTEALWAEGHQAQLMTGIRWNKNLCFPVPSIFAFQKLGLFPPTKHCNILL